MFVGESRFFPFVVTRVRGALDAGGVDAMRAFYAGVHARGARFVHLIDARTAKRPDTLVRQQLAALAKELTPGTKLQVASGIVVDSALTAGVMTALRWAVPAKSPEKHFASVAAALEFLEPIATTEGIAIPAAARAWLERLNADPDANPA